MTINELQERNRKYRSDIDELVKEHNVIIERKRKLNYEYAADVYPFETGEKIHYINEYYTDYKRFKEEDIEPNVKEGIYGGIDAYYVNGLTAMVRPIIKAIKKDGTPSKNNVGIYSAIIRKTKEEVIEAVKEWRAYKKEHNNGR